MLGYIFLLSFPVNPIPADSFVLSNHKPSPCTTTTLFASQLIIPSVGISSYSSPEHFFLVFCILGGFLPRLFSSLAEVLLRWGFGIYQYYVLYWNSGGLHEKNELFCMKIWAKHTSPPPFMSHFEHLLRFKRE